ncbi:serine hydrolase domain-containing protein [Niabella beijingensis]|uniref:serine hydrolase domain-containing protein n=1 Tax=Niabella beijingensis TaxID=2872700 RepID=UPI001CC12D54|nr:serine hydrolase domain-containing protein [Niabella beijingensis]MBZ4192313.1 beta-lactamase family protein [Niabella beijingensis]
MNHLSAVNAQFNKKLEAIVTSEYPVAAAPGIAVLVQSGDSLFRQCVGQASLQPGGIAITRETAFRLASVSKQFTARAVYELKMAGKLSYDTKLEAVFDQLPPSISSITVGQLLQHTSGIWDYEDLIPEERTAQLTDDDVLQLVRQKDTTYFPPGSAFRYSNTGYCLLALVVERISGMPFPEFLKQQLFDPLQLSGAQVYEAGKEIAHRAYGYHPEQQTFRFADQSVTSATKGDGGVYMSVTAYSRWADDLFRSAGDRSGYFKAITGKAVPVKEGIRYNLGWFICREEDGSIAVFHSGESTGFHNIVYLNPQRKIKIILFSNRDDLKIAALFDRISKELRAGPAAQLHSGSPLFTWLSRLYADE